MEPQISARNIFHKLGFHQDTILPNYVTDIDGEKQNLILMKCDLKSLLQTLEHYIEAFDMGRTRKA